MQHTALKTLGLVAADVYLAAKVLREGIFALLPRCDIPSTATSARIPSSTRV